MKYIPAMSVLVLSLVFLGLREHGDSPQHKGPAPLVRVNTEQLKHLAEQLKAARDKRIQERGELPRLVPVAIRLTDQALISVNHPWTNTPVINASVTSRPYPDGIERRLFGDNAAPSMGALFFNSDPTQAVCFFVDPLWNRVIFGNKSEGWIRSYGEWHGPPRNEYYLAAPRALTVDALPNNYVYVADTENDRIVKLNYSVGYLANVATFHDPRMMHPVDISLSFMGDYIWIADDYSRKILRMDRSGSFPGPAIENYRIGQQTIPLRSPSSVCADNSFFGERLAFVDGASNTFVVGYVSQISGNTLTALSSTEFSQPGSRLASIGVDMNENWWVADPGLGLMHIFDIFGEYLGSINQPTLPERVSTSPSYFDGQYILQVPYIYTAEKWSDDRGLRTYFPGADVIDMRVQETESYFRLSSVLTNACQINVKVVRASDGSVVHTLSSGSSYANPHRTDDIQKSALAYGSYKFRVEVKPLHNEEYGEYAWQDWLVREVPFTYSPAVLQSSTNTATATPNQRKVVSQGDLLHVVYTSNDGVWYCRNFQGVWSAPVLLSMPGVPAKNPSILVSRFGNGDIHVVWEQSSSTGGQLPYYRRSTSAGLSWESTVQLIPNPLFYNNIDATPVLADKPLGAAEGHVVVLWSRRNRDNGTGYIEIAPDPWRNMGDRFVLNGSNSFSRSPSVDGSTNFRVAFADSLTGTIKVQEFALAFDGSGFSISYPGSVQDITAEYPWMHNARNPSIAIADPYVFVSWDADRDEYVAEEEENTPATSHRVFVRGYAPWCGWAPVTEFNHAGHFGHRASVGIDERSGVSKVNLVWECSGQVVKTSRSISGVQWSAIEELEVGFFPSITQHVCGTCTDAPCVVFTSGSSAPYTLAFSSNFFRPTSQLAEGVTPKGFSPGILFNVTRGGAVKLDSLVIGPWRKGALQGDLWLESASFSILRGTAREPLTFSMDTLDFSDWLATASVIVPPDAQRIQGKLKVSVRGFSVREPGIPASLRILTTRLSVENGVNQLVGNIALSDLLKFCGRDTAFFATMTIPAASLRGKSIRLWHRLIGQDENQVPAWSELLSIDSTASTIGRNVTGVSKNEGLDNGLPTELSLDANYPNPFNPSTTIKFDLPEAGYVKLEVFDLLGRKVVSLADGYREAGYHSVVWDATSYASGVYLARFTVTDARASLKFSRVMKLLLTK